ncbi:ABC transporter ATP-binding protein [Streptomyces iranensis]|uniref:Oligopeptide/dipeptide ABC transporter ATP-binding protein n=1 Tax=Streptomyces iranensis TaxID=576784 RepID=A0A060ZB91_9ACTN|nr:dipeptide ABC transporter ATP-binding protein [Streptomyces iranensis]MBP2068564.1 oligopeptide/dipeptide ABC transporter ATP-binding protein [Streptomyces iranensis]CDR01296.1 oligopeptide/dipeptide ABC transporter, ATPasesubunit [Streptomyces iranensis]
MTGDVLLKATDVVKNFPVRGGAAGRRGPVVHAVDGVSLEVRRGETLGVVGESGCGKSTLGRCLVRLGEVTSGRIEFEGQDITRLSRRRLRPVRPGLQMVFQDPYTSLNPRRTVGEIVAEPLLVHRRGTHAEIRATVADILDRVGLTAEQADRYPHEFSGGMRQRVGIARSLALEPRLIVADEPVSALDVSIQAQVLNLFADLQEQLGLTYLFVAHDLGVVRRVSNRIAVMYLGRVVELGPADRVYSTPAHPYTQALLSAVPRIDDGTPAQTPTRERIVLSGDVPNPIDLPSGCTFHPRCPFARDNCRTERPPLSVDATGRQVACHYPLG